MERTIVRCWVLALMLLAGCADAPWEQRYGYYLYDPSPPVNVVNPQKTPEGVTYDGNTSPSLLDRSTDDLEACLERSIDRTSFEVHVPSDWLVSCSDPNEQVLPYETYPSGCEAKGLTQACPCRYRAVVLQPNFIVVTPNLHLYKDALTRFLTGSMNPWIDPQLEPCLTPETP